MITKERITNVSLGGVDFSDAPDFCDAFVEDCEVDGHQATDQELDEISNNYELNAELVYENVWG